MPIYEFRCNQCNTTFEELCLTQRDTEEVMCPECNNKKVNRLMSAFSFTSGNKTTSTASTSASACRSCSQTSCKSCNL